MSIDEVQQYWIPAVRSIYGRNGVSTDTCLSLDALLGVREYQVFLRSQFAYKPLSKNMKKLLVMLASPHGKTILKMYRIRKGLE